MLCFLGQVHKNADSVKQGGFSLIEILLVLGISLTLLLATLPIGLRFFRLENLDVIAHSIATTIRSAEGNAFYGKAGSAWGVRIFPGSYTLFSGATYESRYAPYDETFPIEEGYVLSGDTEVVFAPLEGSTISNKSFQVTSGDEHVQILINTRGVVTIE